MFCGWSIAELSGSVCQCDEQAYRSLYLTTPVKCLNKGLKSCFNNVLTLSINDTFWCITDESTFPQIPPDVNILLVCFKTKYLGIDSFFQSQLLRVLFQKTKATVSI